LRSRSGAYLCRAISRRHPLSCKPSSHLCEERHIDVWEIAWVWAYPVKDKAEIGLLEDELFHAFNAKSALVNGKVPKPRADPPSAPNPAQKVQVMADAEIAEKKDPALRLPRQAEHYSQIVGHFLAVKNSREIAGAIQAHFERLQKYHRQLLGLAVEVEGDSGED
jgi:hypothetical protein